MKFSRLGIVAAFAVALCGQAFAADAPVKLDPAKHTQGQKEAPAAVQAAGLDCMVSDAYFLGAGPDQKVAGKTVHANIYEVACGSSMGYVVSATPGADPLTFDCFTMKDDADKKIAAKQKPGTVCMLPGNADPKQGLVPLLTKAGVSCPAVSQARWLGASPSDKVSLYEAACSNGSGYVLTTPMKDSTKPLSAVDCIKGASVGIECTLTTKDQLQQGVIKIANTLPASAGKATCKPTKGRWVVTDASNGTDYYEVGCADGSTGFMFTTDSKGGFKAVLECVRATRIADGCTLSNADAGQTAESDTYTKLATQIGYPCKVSKYQSYGAETNGPREIVELACGDHPDGAYAMVPTGNGQVGEFFNCIRASSRGLNCRLTPVEATYAKISAQIAARGKTTCTVNGGRGIGKIPSGSEFIEVTCAGAPNLVLEYSKLPQETLVSALPCAQATIADACKLTAKK